jgi:hypothetical protein
MAGATGRGQKGFSVFYVVVATRTRAKADVRTGKGGKAGRRPPVRVKSGPDVPIVAVVVGVVSLALLIGLIAWIVILNRPASSNQHAVAGGVPCDALEHTQVHYHAALQIVYHGVQTNLRDNTGIVTDPTTGKISCYYWLHVHPQDKNVIHIESPASQSFKLGQFFDVWNTWSSANGYGAIKLDSTHVAQFTLSNGDVMKVYVDKGDGKGAQLYTGDPRLIVLASHEVITIEITPPDVTPPPPFTFAAGL